MPNFSEPGWLVPAIVVVSAVGTPVVAWWERRHPSVPADVVELRKWRRLSTREQADADAEALAAEQRASEVNALYHP